MIVPGAVSFTGKKKKNGRATEQLFPVHVSELTFVPPLGHTTRCTGVSYWGKICAIAGYNQFIGKCMLNTNHNGERLQRTGKSDLVSAEDDVGYLKTFKYTNRPRSYLPARMDAKMNARTALFG